MPRDLHQIYVRDIEQFDRLFVSYIIFDNYDNPSP